MLSKHPNLRRYRNSVRKNMQTVTLHEARRIVSLHHVLANAGVPVPRTLLDLSTCELCMPYLSDTTAYQFLSQDSVGMSDESRWSILFNSDISPLLPLTLLHALPLNNVSVSLSRPWKSIETRLERISQSNRHESDKYPIAFSNLQQCYTRLRSFELSCQSLQSDKQHLVHGDFHLKQILIDQRKDCAWLIDLDDICIGHIEQDIGNMLAHILTSEEFWKNSLEDHHGWLKQIVVTSLTQHSKTELNSERLAFYTALSLLRRAVKFITDRRYLRHRSRLTDGYINFIGKLIDNPDSGSVQVPSIPQRHKRM